MSILFDKSHFKEGNFLVGHPVRSSPESVFAFSGYSASHMQNYQNRLSVLKEENICNRMVYQTLD